MKLLDIMIQDLGMNTKFVINIEDVVNELKSNGWKGSDLEILLEYIEDLRIEKKIK